MGERDDEAVDCVHSTPLSLVTVKLSVPPRTLTPGTHLVMTKRIVPKHIESPTSKEAIGLAIRGVFGGERT